MTQLHIPKIIGHRGAAGYAPENTLVSIQTAHDMGIDWVELDVKLTADDVPIIMHDDNFLRTCGIDALVKDLPYSEIKDMDAGSWFADSFAGEQIPTLEQAVELITKLGMSFNLEIKPCEGREVETTITTLDLMTRIWDDHDKIMISSFSEVALETAADMLGGDWAIGYLFDETPENWKDMADHLNAKSININGNREDLKREFVEDIIDEGYNILAYTINNPMIAKELLSWGVDGVFTDEPDTIRDELFAMN
jgi:glycerophosphoryl diester phosphodiesterase